jgi:hypothetical protein
MPVFYGEAVLGQAVYENWNQKTKYINNNYAYPNCFRVEFATRVDLQ